MDPARCPFLLELWLRGPFFFDPLQYIFLDLQPIPFFHGLSIQDVNYKDYNGRTALHSVGDAQGKGDPINHRNRKRTPYPRLKDEGFNEALFKGNQSLIAIIARGWQLKYFWIFFYPDPWVTSMFFKWVVQPASRKTQEDPRANKNQWDKDTKCLMFFVWKLLEITLIWSHGWLGFVCLSHYLCCFSAFCLRLLTPWDLIWNHFGCFNKNPRTSWPAWYILSLFGTVDGRNLKRPPGMYKAV